MELSEGMYHLAYGASEEEYCGAKMTEREIANGTGTDNDYIHVIRYQCPEHPLFYTAWIVMGKEE